jgi:EAL domain-containing protein (putative c-di-GMP-specific phosphodiesterase class I)
MEASASGKPHAPAHGGAARRQAGRSGDARLAADASRAPARAWFERLLSSHDFSLVFQPIFELASGELLAAEALVRFSAWSTRPPDAVIAQAHRAGLGVELEVAIVEAAAAHLEELPEQALMAINAGPRALAAGGVAQALAGADASRIIIELTEQVSLDRYPELAAVLASLRRRGVRLAVDDAATGIGPTVDTLALAPDFIKLDRVLAHAIGPEPRRRELLDALVQAAAASGISSCGEKCPSRRCGLSYPPSLRVEERRCAGGGAAPRSRTHARAANTARLAASDFGASDR